jgi:hypothetical protein
LRLIFQRNTIIIAHYLIVNLLILEILNKMEATKDELDAKKV